MISNQDKKVKSSNIHFQRDEGILQSKNCSNHTFSPDLTLALCELIWLLQFIHSNVVYYLDKDVTRDLHSCMAECNVWFGVCPVCCSLSLVTGDTLCRPGRALIAPCSYVKPLAAMCGSSIISCSSRGIMNRVSIIWGVAHIKSRTLWITES